MRTEPTRGEGGFTVLEAAISMTVLAVSLLSLWSTISYCSRSNVAAEQKRRALDAGQAMIEQLKSDDFGTLVKVYGAGGSVGNKFPVPTLDSDESRAWGEIVFYVDETQPFGPGAGVPAMDLNGDGDAVDTDVSDSYTLLPVRVVITWQGGLGEQHLELSAILQEEK